MHMIDLPEGWALSTLPESIAIDGLISDGDWVESKDQDPNGSIRLIQLADIGDGDFKNKSKRFMSPDRADALNCTYLESGDVLIARMPDPLGRACLFPDIGQDAVTVVDICLIRTGKKTAIINKLLMYWINSPVIRDLIYANSSGTTRTRITRKKLELFEFPIPPLAEQKVIADKLDSLLAQVKATKARLERIPSILKTFRQSVLAAAVSGKLTEQWRDGQSFSTKEGTIGDFVSIDIGHAFKSKQFTDSGVKLLRGQNIEPGSLKWDETRYFPKEKLEDYSHLFIRANDIILAMDRPIISTGLKLARAKEQDLPCVLVQRVARFTNFNYLTPDFLFLLLEDTAFTNYIQPNQTGSDIPHISGKQILSYKIEVPTIAEQAEIVCRVEKLFTLANNIEQRAKAALELANNLTQSILIKAFTGELSADWRTANPELISGDNSVEVLLKKIKANREALEKQPKPKRSAIKEKTDNRMSKQIIKVVETLKQAGKPLSGQQLLAAAGYPSDSNTEQLEQFFLDIRNALAIEKSIVKLERDNDSQDWFALAKDSQ